MDKQKRHIFAALIIVLLIVAVLTAWLTADFSGNEDDSGTEPTPSASASPSAEPSESIPLPSDSAAPEATPSLTPSEEVSEERVLNGSFDSSTGCTLNTHTEWAVIKSSSGKYTIEVKVYLRSYTVGIGPRTGSVSILGTNYRFATESISVESNSRPQDTLLYAVSQELPVTAGELLSVPISVSWNFAGVYSGNDIDNIESQTTVTIQG